MNSSTMMRGSISLYYLTRFFVIAPLQPISACFYKRGVAHVLGHAIMHRISTEHIEDEANAFAGELLVPERQFRRLLIGQKVTLEWLARQKAYWRTSMAFLLYRVGEVGAHTRHQTEMREGRQPRRFGRR
jgi:hypothetical protein